MEKEGTFMLPRFLLIFVLIVLIALALKKGSRPEQEVFQSAPGYPAPVALKRLESLSDEEFLKNLPSGSDYAFSLVLKEKQGATTLDIKTPSNKVQFEKKKTKKAKRFVAAKIKMRKR